MGMRPRLVYGLTEVPRMAGEVGEYAALRRLLGRAARGDGHHVLVLPGLMAGDHTTAIVRNFLKGQGFVPHGWGMGRNVGPTRLVVDSMQETVQSLTAEHGPISIVGWSLGGLYARQLGRRHCDQVRQVVTLASPFRLANREETLAGRVYNRFRHLHVAAEEVDAPEEEHLREPMPVPTTAFYSRSDGVVPWQACLNELYGCAENIEVRASHIGMGYHPATLWALADRLAQPADDWQPFAPPRALRRWYPAPAHWPLDEDVLAQDNLVPISEQAVTEAAG